jgi:hypothetical protein
MQKGKAKMKVFTAQLLSTFTKAFASKEPAIQEVGRENLISLLTLGPKIELLLSDLGKMGTPEGLQLFEETMQTAKVTDNDRKSVLTKVANSNSAYKKQITLLLYPDVASIPFTPDLVPLIYELIGDYPDLYKMLVDFVLAEAATISYDQIAEVMGGKVDDFFVDLLEEIADDIFKYMHLLEQIPEVYLTKDRVIIVLPALAEAFRENEEVEDILSIVLKLDSGNSFAEECLDGLEGENLETIADFIDEQGD